MSPGGKPVIREAGQRDRAAKRAQRGPQQRIEVGLVVVARLHPRVVPAGQGGGGWVGGCKRAHAKLAHTPSSHTGTPRNAEHAHTHANMPAMHTHTRHAHTRHTPTTTESCPGG